MNIPPLLHWWYTALEEEIGIALETDDIDRTKAGLYKARAESSDEALEGVSIVVPPGTTNVLWLIKNKKAQTEPIE